MFCAFILSTFFFVGNENNCEDADETDTYDDSSIHNFSYSWQDNDRTSVHSTPRPSAKFMTSKRTIKSIGHESPSRVSLF